jgi:ABC-2 type transport system permease protein
MQVSEPVFNPALVTTQQPSPTRLMLRAWIWMLRRDLVVGRRQLVAFLMMFLLQPVFYLFVFGKVLPAMQLADARYTLFVAPGIVAFTLFLAGVQSTAFTTASEFGWTREVEDRIMAPIAWELVALEKIVYGTLQAMLGALVILLLARPILGDWPVPSQWRWSIVVPTIILSGLLSASLGLALGTRVRAANIGMVFSMVLGPMMFLGGPFYPWSGLDGFPILKAVSLVNPLLYISEGFRAGMIDGYVSLPPALIFAVLMLTIVLLASAGIGGFVKRARESS